MSTPIIEIPRLNPVQFVEALQPADNRIHIHHPLADWFSRGIRDAQDHVDYFQKYQTDDFIRVQFHATANSSRTLNVMKPQADGTAHAIYPVPLSLSVAVPGNVEKRTGTAQQLTTYQYNFRFSDIGALAEGVYYLQWDVALTDLPKTLISEPIHIKANHRGTLLLRYYNEANDYGTIFEQTSAKFYLRVEADLADLTPASVTTTYIDQVRRRSKLSGYPDRFFSFSLIDVPEWVLDKVDAISICDHITIDEIGVVRDQADKWEVQRTDGAPLVAASLIVYESDPDGSTVVAGASPLELYTLPGAYPYALATLRMGEGGVANVNLLPAGPRVITGAGMETTLVSNLNTLAGTYGYTGTFSIAAGILIYTGGAGEGYNSALASVLTSYFDLFVSTLSTFYPISIQHQFARIVVAWGDGAVNGYTSFNTLATETHTYAAIGGGYHILVFGTLKTFNISDPAFQDITGIMPAALQSLSLQAAPGYGPNLFDASILAACAGSLQSLQVSNSQVASVTNYAAQDFTQLRLVNFSNNELDQAGISFLVRDVKNDVIASPVYGGLLYVNAQTPATSLNSTGIAAKGLLGGTYGWTVTA